jgi:hypothetical protein
MDPRLIRALVAWLVARESRLGGRVRPSIEQPGSAGPYLTYTVVSTDLVGNMESRTGETATRVQLDVWSQDHATGMDIAANIKGTGDGADPAARGLDYFAGEWPDPADDESPVTVQFAELVSESFDDAAPVLGTETPWYRFSADFRITYERV